MFGLFQLFGRSRELKALDHALREAGVHPRTVPEAVKLTVLRLLKQEANAGSAVCETTLGAAQLLGYCMLGHDQFVASNSIGAANGSEDRLEAPIVAGDGLGARIILLALHSGVIVSEVADRFEIETD